MKKFLSLFIVSFFTVVAFSSPAQAFIEQILKGPANIPVTNPIHTVSTVTDGVGQLLLTSGQTLTTTMNNVNNAKTAVNSVMNFNYTALLDGTVTPGQLEYVSCDTGDIRVDTLDKDSVAEAVDKLFFRYPGILSGDIQSYNEKRDWFYKDSVIEAYVAARELDLYMKDSVIPNFEKGSRCINGEASDCGISNADGGNEVVYNEAKALQSIDDMLAVLQKAIAIKAQLNAVRAIKAIPPAPYDVYDEEMEEDSAKATENLASAFTLSVSQPLAFAKLEDDSLSAVEDAATGSTLGTSRVLNQALAFSEAPESQQQHPYAQAEESMDKIAELEFVGTAVDNATEAHNMILELKSYQQAAIEYKKAQEEHKKALTLLQKSNQCAQNYIGRYFSNPSGVWSGGSFNGANVANHDSRRGISAWAIDAFETAKAAQTSSLTADDYPVGNIDDDELESYQDYTKGEQNVNRFRQNNPSTIGASKEETAAKEGRIAEMLPWQIGAEASKMLAAQPQKWGTPAKAFPVWNDTKSFYNQYLSGKYANVRDYLKAFSTSDVKALIVAASSGQQRDATETAKQKSVAEIAAKQTAELKNLQNEKSSASLEVATAAAKSGSALENQRKALVAEIDLVAKKAKQLSDDLASARQNAEQQAVEKLQKSVTEYDGFSGYSAQTIIDEAAPTDNHSSLNLGESKFTSSFSIAGAFLNDGEEIEQQLQQQTAENRADSNIADLEQQLKTQNQKLENLQQQLQQLDRQINQSKLNSQLKHNDLNQSFTQKVQAATAAASEQKDKLEQSFTAAADANIGAIASAAAEKLEQEFLKTNPGGVYNGLTASSLSAALDAVINKALGDLYDKVDQRINTAQKQLAALGEDLYKPENHSRIVKIHQDMINDIKALPLTVNYRPLGIAVTVYMYAKLIPADDSAETEAFFVGNPAKQRDLKAPKQVLTYNLPPLREYVHFDETDFQNVKPFDAARQKSEPIAKDDFLNYGGEVPEIWKLMLQDHAFVETEFNLQKALNTGCSAVAFFRGGYMPCRVAGSSIIVDVNTDGRYIRGQSGPVVYDCPALEMKNGRVYDPYLEVNIDFASAADQPAPTCAYSELGTLLDADENNTVSFRQSTYNTFYNIIKQQQDYEKDGETPTALKQKLAAASAAPLRIDQIGDFLNFVENEQDHRRSVEELKMSYDEVMATLQTALQKFGLEQTQEFDLTKQADYQIARNTLDRIKNNQIKEALEKLEQIEVPADDEVLAERMAKYQKIIAALQKDNEETVVITAAVVDNNNLDAEVKTAKVDQEVADRYEQALEKQNNKLNINVAPYCSIY